MTRPRPTLLWIRVNLVILLLAGSVIAVLQLWRSTPLGELIAAPARRGDFRIIVRCRGELIAPLSIELTAPGNVPDLEIVWEATAGSDVKVGETVIRFDGSRPQQELEKKTAALKRAQARLDQAIAQARIAADQDKMDLSTATSDLERARLEASKKAIVSRIQGQESAIDLGLAEEKVKGRRVAIELHNKSDEARIAWLQRLRDQAQSEVSLTQRLLERMEVRSPVKGVITYLPNYSQGWINAQPFKVGDHVIPGGAIAQIPDLSTLQVESKVDEVDRWRIALGDSVLVRVDAFPGKVLTAKLVMITPLTEQSFNEWPPTRSFRARAQIKDADPRMRPGMNSEADIVHTNIPNAVIIPAKALFTIRGKPVVYLKVYGDYRPTNVEVRARNPDEVAVEGIAAGSVVALAEPVRVKR
jgi:HlyD family secretion protein